MRQQKHRFIALDGLRGVAALAVAIMHLYQMAAYRQHVLLPAAVAVDFFFMLSGFVLAFAYLPALDNGMTWTRFMKARVIRLYPLIPVGVLLGAILALLRQHATGVAIPGEQWFAVPVSLLVLPAGLSAPRPTSNFSFDPPLWSLFFEFLASAIFATRLRNMGKSGATMFLLATGILDLAATYLRTTSTIIEDGGLASLAVNAPRTAFAFALGVAIYRSELWRKVPSTPFLLTGTTLAVVLLVPGENGPLYNIAVLLIVMPLMLLLGSKAEARPAGLCKWLGDLSYPLYVLHYPIGRGIIYVVKSQIPDVKLQTIIALVGSIAVSAVALKLYDEPVRRWLSGRSKRRTGKLDAALTSPTF